MQSGCIISVLELLKSVPKFLAMNAGNQSSLANTQGEVCRGLVLEAWWSCQIELYISNA